MTLTYHNFHITPTIPHKPPYPHFAMARYHPEKASSSSKKESNTNKCMLTRKSEMVLLSQSDKYAIIITRLLRASSSSKKESNTNKSLSTRKSEMVSSLQSDKCTIIITHLFQFNRRIMAESGYENDYSNRKYDAREKDYVVQQFCGM